MESKVSASVQLSFPLLVIPFGQGFINKPKQLAVACSFEVIGKIVSRTMGLKHGGLQYTSFLNYFDNRYTWIFISLVGLMNN